MKSVWIKRRKQHKERQTRGKRGKHCTIYNTTQNSQNLPRSIVNEQLLRDGGDDDGALVEVVNVDYVVVVVVAVDVAVVDHSHSHGLYLLLLLPNVLLLLL